MKELKEQSIRIVEDRKTFKLGLIVLISTLGLQVSRMVSGFFPTMVPIYKSWLFTFLNQGFFMGILPIFLYKILISKKHSELVADIYLSVKLPSKIYYLAIAAGLAMTSFAALPSMLSNWFLSSIGYQRNLSAGTLYTKGWMLFAELIVVAVFPALFEELVDRGFLMGALKNIENTSFKVLIMGRSFGLAHQYMPQFFPTFVAGMVISYVAILTGSIWPGVIMHFINNFSVVVIGYIEQKTYMANPMVFITGSSTSSLFSVLITPIIAGVILFFVIKSIKNTIAKLNFPKVKDYNMAKGCYEIESNDKTYVVYGENPIDTINNINEIEKLIKTMSFIIEDSFELKEKLKVKVWEYSPIIISLSSAAFITIMTLIWGF